VRNNPFSVLARGKKRFSRRAAKNARENEISVNIYPNDNLNRYCGIEYGEKYI